MNVGTAGIRRLLAPVIAAAAVAMRVSAAQEAPFVEYRGEEIPPEVEAMYTRGLAYLVATQTEAGNWQDSNGSGAGVVGLAVLSMLAHGDDPNQGAYSKTIKKGIGFILGAMNAQNGYIGPSMYHHGFATLALAEAYGAVDDARIGPALEKAVALILSAQSRNRSGAWRYSPESSDADTTVSGAQMIALFAARNAGIGVPDAAIESGLRFYKSCQGTDGSIGYTSGGSHGDGGVRTAIGALAYALAHRKDGVEFKGAFRSLKAGGRGYGSGNYYYFLYYAAQAYFHGEMEAWNVWNTGNIKSLKSSQNTDGSWAGNEGPVFCTAAALLSMAVDYRFLPIYER